MSTHIQRSALLPYPAQALFDLVNDVASYPQFLPWCSASEVLESSDTHMRASLAVAKGGLSQRLPSYTGSGSSRRWATKPARSAWT
jgi:ribosome-associated toxin RatA of RatAB toxin-antitoxin module